MAMADPSPMIVQLPSRPLTLDDVAELAATDDAHRYELDEGNLLVMPPADAEQAALIMRIGAWLINSGCGPDRVLATPGYAEAGVQHYWRVERSRRAPTVHIDVLGTDPDGRPAYVGHEAQLLSGLLAGKPPELA